MRHEEALLFLVYMLCLFVCCYSHFVIYVTFMNMREFVLFVLCHTHALFWSSCLMVTLCYAMHDAHMFYAILCLHMGRVL